MVIFLQRLIGVVFGLYFWIFFARIVLSLLVLLPQFRLNYYYHPVVRSLIKITEQMTEPLLAPLRRYIPPMGGLDFTPMVAIFILQLVEWLLQTLVWVLFG